MKTVNQRTTEYEIKDIFLERYSPRAMSGESISKEELYTLFEAARWAPSSRNIQPWRFIYATNKSPEFQKFLSFANEGNRLWCHKASVLVVVISKKTTNDGQPSPTHSFDAGSAWENLALQASQMNIIAHGMGGIFPELIREKLSIPNDYNVEMMIAIGKHGNVEDLSDSLRLRENPNDRKPMHEIVFEDRFMP
jgi:nitroreductase